MVTVTSDLPPQLCERDAWTGGFYELAMQLGERDDVRLQVAVGVLARRAGITGPWHVQWQPDRVRPVSWSSADLVAGQLRGQAQLPGGQQVICAVAAVREDRGDDWLDLCIPLEALGRGDARIGGFPFEPDGGASLSWRRPIDDWLARLADEIRQETGFRHAVIGFEVSGSVRAETLTDQPEDRPYALVIWVSKELSPHSVTRGIQAVPRSDDTDAGTLDGATWELGREGTAHVRL